MRRSFVLSAILILCCGLIGCFNQSIEVRNAEKQSALYARFTELKTPPYDMKQIIKVYRDLTATMLKADQLKPGLKAETEEFLIKAQTDINQDAYLEGVEKRLQRAFVLLMEKSLQNIENDKSNNEQAMESFQLAKAYFKVIDITGKRRGSLFHDENIFYNQFISIFENLEREIRAHHQDQIPLLNQKIIGLTNQVYFLSVLYEVNGLAEIQGQNDEMEKLAKKTEASSYFAIIREAAQDPAAIQAIDQEFVKPASEMNVSTMKENFKLAYPEIAEKYSVLFRE